MAWDDCIGEEIAELFGDHRAEIVDDWHWHLSVRKPMTQAWLDRVSVRTPEPLKMRRIRRTPEEMRAARNKRRRKRCLVCNRECQRKSAYGNAVRYCGNRCKQIAYTERHPGRKLEQMREWRAKAVAPGRRERWLSLVCKSCGAGIGREPGRHRPPSYCIGCKEGR